VREIGNSANLLFMRGRKPKPTARHRIDGTRFKGDRTAEPVAHGKLDAAPEGLTASQADLWRYHVQHAPPGVLAAIDAQLLVTFVRALDMQNQAAALMAADGLVVEGDRGPTEHPAVRTFARASALALKCAEQMGFTPASRPRIQASPEPAGLNPFAAFAQRDPAPKPH
jgi:P27 family predicted phage terminase small subunit